ncbi:arsenate reductase like protein [Deinococcus proteolyticus MRP]|uniref:Arsenate reductase like protein n=1 Tax=Deinococcus proteolyticus (strain ATCC 35074 / DSM 20540 / JCM 6276 / NBRC 101906 / NCIMB 13154 / VKM Ac-1939 / CCM 2703 / MRP) TaxID=693977 RepID=F0RLH2_DEIPM|nr:MULTISPECIES: ArsC/Spx/MgsR family protein [Deinococcus]ADY26896.1 arsenate reductase like protein [Deinococcus proteolyticus MRP]MCY1703021.1 arsenate reductase [Deinococcus sp. SL84]
MAQNPVQIFGTKKSKGARAAERFFKERGVKIHYVDLTQRPLAKGELTRFVQKFGLNALLDMEGKAYRDAGLEYLRVTDDRLLEKMLQDPGLLRLPLVRGGKVLAVGEDAAAKAAWAEMVQ